MTMPGGVGQQAVSQKLRTDYDFDPEVEMVSFPDGVLSNSTELLKQIGGSTSLLPEGQVDL